MKKKNELLTSTCLLLCLLTGCAKTSEDDQVRQEVLASFESLVASSKALDTQTYFKHFDNEKFSGLDASGQNWNSIDDLRALIEPGFNAVTKVDSLQFNNVKVTVVDSRNAVLVNEFEQLLTLKSGDQISLAGGGVQVWHKADGNWLLVSVAASNKPQP